LAELRSRTRQHGLASSRASPSGAPPRGRWPSADQKPSGVNPNPSPAAAGDGNRLLLRRLCLWLVVRPRYPAPLHGLRIVRVGGHGENLRTVASRPSAPSSYGNAPCPCPNSVQGENCTMPITTTRRVLKALELFGEQVPDAKDVPGASERVPTDSGFLTTASEGRSLSSSASALIRHVWRSSVTILRASS